MSNNQNNHTNNVERAAHAILEATEKIVDENLHNYHRVDDDVALQALRQKRLQEMKQASSKRAQYLQNGHGTYTELENTQTSDTAKDFFALTKVSPNVVVHFYQPTNQYADVFHAHLTKLAPRYLETKFCKINVQDTEKISTRFLVERLQIQVLPCLVLIRNRQMIHQVRGFDELERQQHCSANDLARLLGQYKVIESCDNSDDDNSDDGGRDARNRVSSLGSRTFRSSDIDI